MDKKSYEVSDFYAFKIGPMWRYFKGQHLSFWMICAYLFFEFVKPQAIFPAIDFLPWAQVFLIGSIVGALIDPSVKWVSSSANIYVAIFFAIICISIFTAHYPEIAKKHFMLILGWVLIYYLIVNIVNTPQRFYIFLLIYIAAAGKIALGTSKTWVLRGFTFSSWGLKGPSGFFENSGELSVLMIMLFPLAFYLYQFLKYKVSIWERGLLLIFWVCPILTVLGASSRGAQVALALQVLFMFRKGIFRIKALFGILILVASMLILLPAEQKERFTSAGEDKSSQQRLLYWEHGWDMMKEYPLTGVGFFNFIPYYEDYYSSDMLYTIAQLPHNIFIQVGTDAGFPAVVLFICIISFCLITTIKSVKTKDVDGFNSAIFAGLGYGVFGFLIAGQFVTISYYPFLWVHLAFIVSLVNVIKRPNATHAAASN
jgi:O-antigen ligase